MNLVTAPEIYVFDLYLLKCSYEKTKKVDIIYWVLQVTKLYEIWYA